MQFPFLKYISEALLSYFDLSKGIESVLLLKTRVFFSTKYPQFYSRVKLYIQRVKTFATSGLRTTA